MRFDASAHNGTVATQSGVYFGHVLLHERRLAAGHPDHRQRPVAQLGEDPVVHAVEVVDEVTLGRAGAIEQRLVEVGQLDPVARLVAARAGHQRSVSRTIGRSGLRRAISVNPSGSNIDGVPV